MPRNKTTVQKQYKLLRVMYKDLEEQIKVYQSMLHESQQLIDKMEVTLSTIRIVRDNVSDGLNTPEQALQHIYESLPK